MKNPGITFRPLDALDGRFTWKDRDYFFDEPEGTLICFVNEASLVLRPDGTLTVCVAEDETEFRTRFDN